MHKYSLAIESGLNGGSISVFDGMDLFDYRIADKSEHKSDSLLEHINELFESNNLPVKELYQIIISENPGSRIGLKIGFAIAKGISLASGTTYIKKNLYQSIFNTIDILDREVLIVVAANHQKYDAELFNTDREKEDTRLITNPTNDISKLLLDFKGVLAIPKNFYKTKDKVISGKIDIFELEENLSSYLIN